MPLLPVLLAAAVAGLVVASFGSIESSAGWLAIALCLVSARLCSRRPQLARFALLFVWIAFSLFFNLRYPALLQSPDDVTRIDQLARRSTAVAVVTDIRAVSDGRSRIHLRVEEVWDKGKPLGLKRPLRMRLSIEEGSDTLLPGDRIRFNGRLRQPRLFGTPGEFHYARYLASHKIKMTGWVKNMDQIEVLDSGHPGVMRSIVQWRSQIASFIAANLADEKAVLTRALVLGEGRQLPDAVRKTLAGAGVSHLFAISGLHLGLLGLFGYQLLLLLYRRSARLLNWQPPQRVLTLMLLPLLLGYLLFTGDAVSTRRAFALVGIGAFLFLWRYSVNPLHLLAGVALVSLLVNPLLLWQAGWQLSFSGAAGILLWRPFWQHERLNTLPTVPLRYLIQIFLVSCAATLATLPWVLFNFHLLAPAALVANLLCVPIVTLAALPVGFIGLLCYPLWPQAAGLMFQCCGFFLHHLYLFSAWLTAFPLFTEVDLYLSRSQCLAVALMVLPLLLLPQLSRLLWFKLTAVCILLTMVLWQMTLTSPAPVTLTMLSVGQGESLLLQNRAGQNILIDGGGLYGDRFDVGQRLLAPAFGELGVRQFDRIILTHNHADHWKGLVYILDRYPVAELVIGESLASYNRALTEVVARRAIPVRLIEQGWTPFADWKEGDLSLYNDSDAATHPNDASLVLHLRHKDQQGNEQGLLLTGDLEAEGINRLILAGIPRPVTLLKLPHHGSGKSGAEILADLLQPQVGLVSVGYQNIYRLPTAQVMENLSEKDVEVFRTDLNGSIRAQLKGSGWRLQTWHQGLFR